MLRPTAFICTRCSSPPRPKVIIKEVLTVHPLRETDPDAIIAAFNKTSVGAARKPDLAG